MTRSLTKPDMNTNNPNEFPTEEGTDNKLKRDLLWIALAGLLLPCGLCWTSLRSTSFETTLIPLLQGAVVGGYSLYAFYQRENEKDLTLRLWKEVLSFGLAP